MILQRFPTLLVFLAATAMAPSLVQGVPTPKDVGRMSDAAWDDLVDQIFVKYSHQNADDANNGVEPTYGNDEVKVSPLIQSVLERQANFGAKNPTDDVDEDDDGGHIEVAITLAGPELYENISDDALGFDLGDDVLMLVESDDASDNAGNGHRRKHVRRRRVEAGSERRARLRQFERRLNSFKIRVLRKGVRKTCQCRTSTLKGCRRCGGECCHSIANGTVKCREGSRDSCRRIFGKKTKSKFKRRNSSSSSSSD